jgi:hypothetical protein
MNKGTLVWVESMVGDAQSREMTTKHGKLWVVEKQAAGLGDWYWCKSISTGYIYDWHEHDMQVHETKEPNNVRQEGAE